MPMLNKENLEMFRPWPITDGGGRVAIGNRHDHKRWLRRALVCACVANDALLCGRRALAAIVMLEVMPLDAAIRCTVPGEQWLGDPIVDVT